jgi:hypothetical protein
MTSKYYEIEEEIVTTLRDNLTDPIATRPNSANWIYSGVPHPKAKTPRIHVTRRSETAPYGRLGTYKQDQILQYQVMVHIRQGCKGSVDGTTYSGTALLNQLCDEIAETLETNAGSITGVQTLRRVDGGGYYYNDKTKNYECPMTFEAWVVNR